MGRRKKRTGIVLLNDHMKLAEKLLKADELGRLYIAVRRYSMEGIIGDYGTESGGWLAVFELMRDAQDNANQLYEETCVRNRLRVLKRYAGATAGSSGSAGSQSYQSNQNKTNQNKSNQNKTKQVDDSDNSSVIGLEDTGVTGIAWL